MTTQPDSFPEDQFQNVPAMKNQYSPDSNACYHVDEPAPKTYSFRTVLFVGLLCAGLALLVAVLFVKSLSLHL